MKTFIIAFVCATCVWCLISLVIFLSKREQSIIEQSHIHTFGKWENTPTIGSDMTQTRYCTSCNVMERN